MGAHGRSGNAMVGLRRNLNVHEPEPESSDLALADVYRIPLAAPAVMAKEIKTRARSLESVLEGVEIKHPLVQVTPPCKVSYLIAFVLVLDASQEPYGDHIFRRS
jgi:hypothetical protein